LTLSPLLSRERHHQSRQPAHHRDLDSDQPHRRMVCKNRGASHPVDLRGVQAEPRGNLDCAAARRCTLVWTDKARASRCRRPDRTSLHHLKTETWFANRKVRATYNPGARRTNSVTFVLQATLGAAIDGGRIPSSR
jgi:hypothetical protein